jgi:hypothetical protein
VQERIFEAFASPSRRKASKQTTIIDETVQSALRRKNSLSETSETLENLIPSPEMLVLDNPKNKRTRTFDYDPPRTNGH